MYLKILSLLSLFVEVIIVLIFFINMLNLKKGIIKSIKRIFILIFLLLPSSQGILLLGIYIYNSEHLDERLLQYVLICLLVSLTVDILIYYTIKEYSKLSQKEKYLEIEKMQKQMDLSYYQLASKSNDDLHKLKHDIRNQLQAAYALLASNKDEIKAKGIIDDINYKLETVDNTYYCENQIINTIITLKTVEAKNHNIKSNIILKDINQLIIDDIDLCSIFTNLYDNAINCCINNKSKENNFINIKTTNNGGYIIIKFINWCDLDIKFNKKNTISTTNNDSKNHGYGLKILKDIANKYDGNLKLKKEDNIFEAILLLKSNTYNC